MSATIGKCMCGAVDVPLGKVEMREEGMHYARDLRQQHCETYSCRPILPGQPAPRDGWYEWGEMPPPPRFAWLGCAACFYGTSFGDCGRTGEKAHGRCDYWKPGFRDPAPSQRAGRNADATETTPAVAPCETNPTGGTNAD